MNKLMKFKLLALFLVSAMANPLMAVKVNIELDGQKLCDLDVQCRTAPGDGGQDIDWMAASKDQRRGALDGEIERQKIANIDSSLLDYIASDDGQGCRSEDESGFKFVVFTKSKPSIPPVIPQLPLHLLPAASLSSSSTPAEVSEDDQVPLLPRFRKSSKSDEHDSSSSSAPHNFFDLKVDGEEHSDFTVHAVSARESSSSESATESREDSSSSSRALSRKSGSGESHKASEALRKIRKEIAASRNKAAADDSAAGIDSDHDKTLLTPASLSRRSRSKDKGKRKQSVRSSSVSSAHPAASASDSGEGSDDCEVNSESESSGSEFDIEDAIKFFVTKSGGKILDRSDEADAPKPPAPEFIDVLIPGKETTINHGRPTLRKLSLVAGVTSLLAMIAFAGRETVEIIKDLRSKDDDLTVEATTSDLEGDDDKLLSRKVMGFATAFVCGIASLCFYRKFAPFSKDKNVTTTTKVRNPDYVDPSKPADPVDLTDPSRLPHPPSGTSWLPSFPLTTGGRLKGNDELVRQVTEMIAALQLGDQAKATELLQTLMPQAQPSSGSPKLITAPEGEGSFAVDHQALLLCQALIAQMESSGPRRLMTESSNFYGELLKCFYERKHELLSSVEPHPRVTELTDEQARLLAETEKKDQ